ncbi:hypothetical protein BKK81_20065 [Cupriavidus sp. USMAHM13]|uniref:HTH lysR-type domain-containing protein n=1 Tax=Cupriavidus malaysiensis TaxID=367825 RepID=A0ABM6FA82_9BURK|nr:MULTISPECIES: LysR family transcriptional regulator [Cupriavidus]AOZ01679.1 hypothetical protein BKK81_20065 [Cupriavidus sp. USMAHM13]AOZ08571.1 hypothetical protein BKK80_21740 [Cupriavidus malaysiensis]
MKIQQLHDLAAVVRHGGIRAAARARRASQAGITLSLQRLEQQYGLSLFVRNGRGITLTSHGEIALRHAEAVLREWERAEQALRSMACQRASTVRIGLSLDPSIFVGTHVLPEFQRRLPDVELHVMHGASETIVHALRAGRIELAIATLPPPADRAGLRCSALYDSVPAILCRQGHPLAAARKASALRDCNWIVLADAWSVPASGASTSTQSNVRQRFEQKMAGHGLPPPRSVLVLSSLMDAVLLMGASDYLAEMPRGVLERAGSPHGLLALELDDMLPPRQVGLMRAADRPLPAEARTLAAMLASFGRIRQALRGGVRPG